METVTVEPVEHFDISVDSAASICDVPYEVQSLEKFGGISGVIEKLKTDPLNGLSEEEAQADFKQRRSWFGENVLPAPIQHTFWKFFKEALDDTTLKILMAAAVVSTLLGLFGDEEAEGWIEGAAIFAAVLLVSLVTAINNYKKQFQFINLYKKQQEKDVKAMRNGEITYVPVDKVLVGEIIKIGAGDILATDGLLIKGQDVRCDESAMTGESDEIKKTPETCPFLLSGCPITSGTGIMVVTAVGVRSQAGKMKQSIVEQASTNTATPLEVKLESLAILVGKIGLTFSIATMLLLFVRYVIDWDSELSWVDHMSSFTHFFVIGVTIIVVAVPEGLPLAVTISLAYSMRRMLTDNNLVRKLASCETMGGATTICSDKDRNSYSKPNDCNEFSCKWTDFQG
ncbi:hypothetical protein RCL1_008597 [Eukaryota sp. TZLM3-RCL]